MTYNLQFRIDAIRKLFYIGAISAPITSTLPSNVSLVEFKDGVGYITYNDRVAIPETFTDPAPYQSYLNQWMTAMAAASPALTLAQAQALKCALIQMIYIDRMQNPQHVSISSGTFTFAATNDDYSGLYRGAWLYGMSQVITALNSVIGTNTSVVSQLNGVFSTMVTQINSAFSTWYSQINSNLSTCNTAMTSIASQITATNTAIADASNDSYQFAYYMNQNFVSIQNSGISLSPSMYTSFAQWSLPGVSYSPTYCAGVSAESISAESITASGSSIATLTASPNILPIGSTSYPTMTLADMFNVIQVIESAQSSAKLTNASKQAAVNALTSISSVISYDANVGW